MVFVGSISDLFLAVNRWLSVRFNLLSSAIVGVTAVVAILTPSIDAALAGFILAFASTITNDVRAASLQVELPRLIEALADSLFGPTVRQFGAVDGELVPLTAHCWPLTTAAWPQVALERVKEYSELKREPPEFIEPRPPASWPSKGEIDCEGLVIRYAVSIFVTDKRRLARLTLHTARPAERAAQPQLFYSPWREGRRDRFLSADDVFSGGVCQVGILGRTGSGKSTLALSFFRFVEATEGCIRVDGLDISQIGLTDLRSKLTIIPRECSALLDLLRLFLNRARRQRTPPS